MLNFLAVFLAAQMGFTAVIGKDNMIRYRDLGSFSVPELAKATATQIDGSRLVPLDSDFSQYPAGKLHGLCPGERFFGERTLGGCSGFLVAADILVTAGHCHDYARGCGDDAWVFGHTANTENPSYKIANKSIYRCGAVIESKKEDGIDYAVIRLDRPVVGAKPFSISLAGDVAVKDPLAVMGYPLGLPFTFTPGGNVLAIQDRILHTDLDVHSNNSGSVVFNLRTGLAEGILTHGVSGLSINPLDGCRETKHLSQGVSYVNRLNQIRFLKENFSSSPPVKHYSIANNCNREAQVVLKYRSTDDNAFSTRSFSLSPGELARQDTKPAAVYIFARDKSGKAIVKGTDFYGFENGGRQEELGFREFKGERILLCD